MPYISVERYQRNYDNEKLYWADFDRLDKLASVDGVDTFELTTPNGITVTYEANVFRLDKEDGYFRVYYEVTMAVGNELTALGMMRDAA